MSIVHFFLILDILRQKHKVLMPVFFFNLNGHKQVVFLEKNNHKNCNLSVANNGLHLNFLIKLNAPGSQLSFSFFWNMEYSMEYKNQQNGIFHKNWTTT